MSETSLFYNALQDPKSPTGYDRNYNADDISNWLAIIYENGVVRGGLEVKAGQGLSVNVEPGAAAIKGKPYRNNTIKSLPIETAPTINESRFDLIVLHYNNTLPVRNTFLKYKKGTSARPTINDLERSADVYELLLAVVEVAPNAVNIQQANISDMRENKELCGYFTAVKGYQDYYDAIVEEHQSTITLTTTTTEVISNLASSLYNNRFSLVEIYTNGIKESKENYTLNSSGAYLACTFKQPKATGAVVNFVINNFLDGEGMQTALTQYTNLVQDVNELKLAKTFNYFCNGVNDNVLISNIINDFIAKNQSYYQTIKLNIIGKLGITAPVQGDGTIANAYKIFNFTEGAGNKKISLDFSNAHNFIIQATPGKITEIFSGGNCEIVGATIVANEKAVNTTIRAFSEHKRWRVVKCNFYIFAYENAKLGYFGNFIDSKATITNEVGNSYCFYPKEGGVLQINGGEYTAYTKTSSNVAAVIGQYENTTTIINNMSAPTQNKTGYVQTHCINQSSGDLTCFGLLSALPNVKNAQAQLIGTINKSVFNQVW